MAVALVTLPVAVPTGHAQPQGAAAAPDSGRLSALTFFRPPALAQARLSPSGRYLGVLVGSDKARTRLAVIDLDTAGKAQIVGAFDGADVRSFHWVNDQRLVFDAIDTHRGLGEQYPPGLWAINRDGGEARQLIDRAGSLGVRRGLSDQWRLHSLLHDGSADIVVAQDHWSHGGEFRGITIARVNTSSGDAKVMLGLGEGPPESVTEWLLDRAGRPVMASTHKGDKGAVYRRQAGDRGWRKLLEFPLFGGTPLKPVAVDGGGTVYVVAKDKTGASALFRLDEVSGEPEAAPLVSVAGFDLDPALAFDEVSGRLLGVHYVNDAHGSAWFDAGMRDTQRRVDALLPATVNHLSCGDCGPGRRVLVTAWSDRQPSIFFLFDRAEGKLERLGESRPWVQPAVMARKDFVRYTARDGRPIPAYVTTPAGPASGPRPAVLLVHGGPYVRGGYWAWEPQAQFLASRGYMVIEPEFRGSTGFGFDHFVAGWKQWGLAMQDDLADAVRWAVEQKMIDPKRVCIAGASYGGYAALMGMVRDPDLYRCAFEWVGVTDIKLMYDITWSDASEQWQRYGAPTLIGDPVRDARQLEETSPLKQAARIRRPLLLAYGGGDHRVPIQHGTEFRSAVQAGGNTQVEWVIYPDEGHGWLLLETKLDFWSRVEKFLDRHIGDGAR